jgi:uncharacterized short protein YbdD (DUF466 family)
MKRFFKWLLGLFPYDKKYVFHRTDSRVDGTARTSIEFYQNVYRRRFFWRKHVWNGTVRVRVVLDGVRFYTQGKKSTTSPLRGAQEYTLRCDNDYVELLKHLTALEVRGSLTVEERLDIMGWQELLMYMWPPGTGRHIHDLNEECDSEQLY